MKKIVFVFFLLILSATGIAKCNLPKGWSQSNSSCYLFNFDGYKVTDSGGSNACIQYSWDFGDNTTAQGKTTKHQYLKNGSYTVCMKVWDSCNNCDTSICKTLTIANCDCDLKTEFSWNNDCKKVKFLAYSNQKTATYTWNFGDKTEGKGADPIHTYLSEGVYKVCLKASWTDANGKVCSVYYCKEITVKCGNPCELKGDFTWGVSSGGNKIRFKGSSNSGYTYEWNFGDGKTGKGIDPYHEYAKAGTYEVCLTIINKTGKCKVKICKKITVGNPCGLLGSFTFKKINDSTWKFYVVSNGPSATTYTWFWGDGTISSGKDPAHTFKKSGVYEICVKIYNPSKKCYLYICKKVEISVPTHSKKCTWTGNLGLGYSKDSNDCNKYFFEMNYLTDSCIRYQISVYNFKTGKTTPLTAGRTGNYVFSDTGKYKIIGKYSNVCTGCDTLLYKTFTVGCKPFVGKCNWASKGVSLGYTNKCNVYTFEGKNLNTPCIKYKISVGGIKYYNRLATHTFSAKGTYTICIFYYDSCNKCDTSICKTLVVDCIPCPAIAKFQVDSVSSNGKMYVKNTSTGSYKYSWSFSDSSANSKDKTPIHQFAKSGTYLVCLTAYDSSAHCSTTYCLEVKVIRSRSKSQSSGYIQRNPYPSPTDLGFYIPLGQGNSTYRIFGTQGQLMGSGMGTDMIYIETKNWAEGFYKIETINGNTRNTQSIIVLH